MSKFARTFHYYPVDFKQSFTGKNVKGFKFPADGNAFNDTKPTDIENLQQFQLYFGVNEVIASLEDFIRTGTNKTNKMYNILLKSLIEDYNKVCITCLELASSMCWVPTYDNKENATGAFAHKLSADRALYEVEPAVKALLMTVQTKIDLTFPTQLAKNIARLEVEKEIIDLKEDVGDVQRVMKKR